jgi:glycosyltransferase involved in cell wall biosynthesis
VTDIVHIISGLGTGGAETMLVQLSVALRARGFSQHVVSLSTHDALAADLKAEGIDVTVLGARSSASLPGVMTSLVRTVSRLQPQIIQGWMYHGNLAASFCHFMCQGKRGRNLFWNIRASNMDDTRYGQLLRFSSLLSHGVDLVVANSEAGAAFHRERGFRPKRTLVISNGINTEKFRPDAEARSRVRVELGIPESALVAIHLARVDPMKDHTGFLAAMDRLPAVVGIMAGAGTQDLPARRNVYALGLRRDTNDLLAAADIVVSTSAFGEGFSNVIAEGMSSGLVPVATDVGDARLIVGETGRVVMPRDPAAFVQAISGIAELPADRRCQLGLAARDRILANFTLAQATDAFADLYSKR